MDNINCQSTCDTVDPKVQIKNDAKSQCVLNRRGEICNDVHGIDSSLLFFFLILVCIVCQCDCDISMDTLLWFFLLLVVLYSQFYY